MSSNAKRSEDDIRKAIIRSLRERGCLVLNLSAVPKAFDHLRGVSDLFVQTPTGRSIWMEIKRPGDGSQNDAQMLFEHRLTSRGGSYVVVTSVDDAVIEALS